MAKISPQSVLMIVMEKRLKKQALCLVHCLVDLLSSSSRLGWFCSSQFRSSHLALLVLEFDGGQMIQVSLTHMQLGIYWPQFFHFSSCGQLSSNKLARSVGFFTWWPLVSCTKRGQVSIDKHFLSLCLKHASYYPIGQSKTLGQTKNSGIEV